MGCRQLWEIAGPQPATHRFSLQWFRSPDSAEPVFRVGSSDPALDWPRVHPGPLNQSTGYRELSATILFEAREGMDRWHVLELSAQDGSGPCPDLRIDVNGHVGLVVPDGIRVDRRHAPSPPSPIGGVIERELWIPPGCLIAGENRLVVTTVAAMPFDRPEADRSQRPDLGSWFGSTLRWVRLALRCEKDAAGAPEPATKVIMTPLYERGARGGLEEITDVLIRNVHDIGKTTVDVALLGQCETYHGSGSEYEFGDVHLRFGAPEQDPENGPFEVRVDVETADGTFTSTHWCLPARKWTVHVLPHVHLDIGYTDAQAKVIELHSNNLDKALEIIDRDPNWKFSIDGSFVVEQYLRSRDSEQVEALLAGLRSGRFSMNAMWALLLSGAAGLEDLYRSMYFATRLAREHEVPIRYANFTDVPSYSAAMPSILYASGIEGFIGIANHTRGGNADSDTLHMLSPVNWRGPDGAEVLAFFADCYSQLRFVCADPATVAGAAQGLSRLLARYERADYLPTDFPLVGSHADNEDLSHGDAGFVERWNSAYVWPRLRWSTMADYLEAVRPLQDRLPVLEGDGGSYWEDGVGTQAVAVAAARQTQDLLPAVEAISVLVTSNTRHLQPDLATLDEAWRCVVVASEHTWTSAHATAHPHSQQTRDQLDWKVSRIRRGYRLATDEMRRALSQLADRVEVPGVPAVIAVNPASWTRTAVIEVELPEHAVVVDEQDRPMPADIGESVEGLRSVRLRLPDLPAFGYRTMAVRTVDDAPSATPSELAPAQVATPYYRADIDPETGAITGLTYLSPNGNQRELLDQEQPWSLGDLLYATGGGTAQGRGLGNEVSSILDYDPELPAARICVESARMGPARVRRTPWGRVIERTGSGPTMPAIHERIEFFDDTDRVEVVVTIEKKATLAKESVYVAFPFAATDPVIGYDRHQGWIDPAKDHQVGACNEWLTIQHAVAVGEKAQAGGVVWSSADAPLFTVSDVVRGTWPRQFEPANGTILSWVMNNYWMTNTPAEQSGHLRLRYAFRPVEQIEPGDSGKFGRELRSPVLVSDVLNTDRCDDLPRPLPSAGTLYDADLPDNVLLTMFAGRAGSAIAVRLHEIGGRQATTVRLIHPLAATDRWAALTTATESELERIEVNADGSISVELAPHQVKTVCFGG